MIVLSINLKFAHFSQENTVVTITINTFYNGFEIWKNEYIGLFSLPKNKCGSDLLESKSPGVLQTKVHTRQRNLHKSVPMTNIAEQHSSSVLSPHLVRRTIW